MWLQISAFKEHDLSNLDKPIYQSAPSERHGDYLLTVTISKHFDYFSIPNLHLLDNPQQTSIVSFAQPGDSSTQGCGLWHITNQLKQAKNAAILRNATSL